MISSEHFINQQHSFYFESEQRKHQTLFDFFLTILKPELHENDEIVEANPKNDEKPETDLNSQISRIEVSLAMFTIPYKSLSWNKNFSVWAQGFGWHRERENLLEIHPPL